MNMIAEKNILKENLKRIKGITNDEEKMMNLYVDNIYRCRSTRSLEYNAYALIGSIQDCEARLCVAPELSEDLRSWVHIAMDNRKRQIPLQEIG